MVVQKLDKSGNLGYLYNQCVVKIFIAYSLKTKIPGFVVCEKLRSKGLKELLLSEFHCKSYLQSDYAF